MATTTIVITYTATGGEDVVSSFTFDGTAYNSLTTANIQDAFRRLKGAWELLSHANASNTTGVQPPATGYPKAGSA